MLPSKKSKRSKSCLSNDFWHMIEQEPSNKKTTIMSNDEMGKTVAKMNYFALLAKLEQGKIRAATLVWFMIV